MSSIADVLPLEIIDEIIGIISNDVDQEDHYFRSPNVKACSLTCHKFSRLCRRHIFHSIKLYEANARLFSEPWNTRRPLARSFANLITKSPEITEYVRELHYIVQNREPQFEDIDPVPPALSGLRRLKSLTIYPDTMGFQWRGAHGVHGSRSILLSLMHLPTIVSIYLGQIRGFIPSDLGPCSNLKNLCLWQVYSAKMDEVDLPITSIRLQRLEADDICNVIDIFRLKGGDRAPIFDLGSLKKITLDIEPGVGDEVSDASGFLGNAKNLEEMHLIFSSSVNAAEFLSTTSLNSVRVLNLDMGIRPLAELHDLLVKLKRMNPHVELLKIRLQNGEEDYYGISPHKSIYWDSFKEDIVNIAWPSLTRFEVGVYTHNPRSDVEPSLEMEIMKGVSSSTSHFLVFRYYNLEGSIPRSRWRIIPW